MGRNAFWSTAPAPATRSRPPAAKEDGSIKHFPLDAFNWIIQINLVGTFRCIAKSAAGMMTLDPMEDGERGAIVNTASVAAEDGQMGQAAYSASKGGVVGMTLPIARDLASENIRVNTILPGIFDTPLMNGAPQNVKRCAGRVGAVPQAPRQAGMEYAKLALTMIENGYFNGEDVRLDGASAWRRAEDRRWRSQPASQGLNPRTSQGCDKRCSRQRASRAPSKRLRQCHRQRLAYQNPQERRRCWRAFRSIARLI
jgi:NAD(P)-dependent dehydrogenase (short-subunit alcohol dehydrogenase family)